MVFIDRIKHWLHDIYTGFHSTCIILHKSIHTDRIFSELDPMPERTHSISRAYGPPLDTSRLYNNGSSIFRRRTEIPPKVWGKTYSLFDIIFESARMAYSSKEEGKHIYSIKELRNDRLTDYELRKIAIKLGLKLRATRVSEEEKHHIIDIYNNLELYDKRVTNDMLVKLLHRNIKTIYNVLNSSESEINWKKRRGAKIISLDDHRRDSGLPVRLEEIVDATPSFDIQSK